jgi:hypothetical protein
MFFRGRQPDVSVWRRFRSNADGFTFRHEGEHYTAHVVANAERVVDLFHALAEQLPPAVDVAVDDVRSGRSWRGESLALPDVREAFARLKAPLAVNGGLEFAAYSSEDQLTVTAQLELFIYSRTDRWLYILQGRGLQEMRDVRSRTWRYRREDFQPAPELDAAFAAVVDRLGLKSA